MAPWKRNGFHLIVNSLSDIENRGYLKNLKSVNFVGKLEEDKNFRNMQHRFKIRRYFNSLFIRAVVRSGFSLLKCMQMGAQGSFCF